jgi:hypothetical protein
MGRPEASFPSYLRRNNPSPATLAPIHSPAPPGRLPLPLSDRSTPCSPIARKPNHRKPSPCPRPRRQDRVLQPCPRRRALRQQLRCPPALPVRP